MRLRLFRQLGPVVAAGALLAACAAGPQDFAVAGDTVPSPAGTPFRSTDPDINDVMAKGYCADGYQKLGQSTLPTDSNATLTEWRVRCTPYRVSFLPF